MAPQSSPPQNFPPGYLDEWNGNLVIAYSALFLTLGTVFLGLRFWSRAIGRIPWGLDDTFIIAAAISLVGITVACLCDVKYGGVGHHIERVIMDDPNTMTTWWKFNMVVPLLYFPAAAFPKLSILALYFRIFGSKNQPVSRMVCWATGFIIAGNCFANVIVSFFMCRPLALVWDKTLHGTCVDINAWWRWCSFPNLVTDVVMLIQPLPHTFKLNMPKKVKVGLVLTFVVGSIGLITAIIRFVGFFTKDYSKDSTWTGTSLLYLSIIEPGLYLVAGCLLSLRPLLKRIWDNSPLTARSKSKNSTGTDNNTHIMQKMSFKVSQNDRFQDLSDSESLVGPANRPGNHAVVRSGGAL